LEDAPSRQTRSFRFDGDRFYHLMEGKTSAVAGIAFFST